MKKIYIAYNPYEIVTCIMIDGESTKSNSSLNIADGIRLQEYVDELPNILLDECNDCNFEITFSGTEEDNEDVRIAFEKCDNISIIDYHFIEKLNITNVEVEVDNIFQDIQNGPIDELKDENIINAFEKAKKQEFEINVLATMSSGKSTLVNALLKKDLMPAANDATTATIVKVIDNDSDEFSAIAYDQEKNAIQQLRNIDKNDIKTLNDNASVAEIHISGDIPFVSANNMRLVLVDTPGPNNAKDANHKAITYERIENSDNSLVICVMNATQLGTEDGERFLDHICKVMNSGGKQTRDRFIIAANKMDSRKPKEEGVDCVAKALSRIKKELQDRGIDNPNIFPVTAAAALEYRIEDEDEDVLHSFKKKTRNYDTLFHFDTYYEFSNLSSEQQRIIEEMKTNADDDSIVDIHSGIVSIELAIEQYINKYARTKKIKSLIDSFKSKVEELSLVENIKTTLKESDEKRQELIDNISIISSNIENAKQAKGNHFQDIDSLDLTSYTKREINDYFLNILNKLNDLRSDNNAMELSLANKALTKIEIYCQDAAVQTKVDIERIIERSYKNAVSNIISEYESHLKMLSNGIDTSSISINPLELVNCEIEDLSKIINENIRIDDQGYYETEEKTKINVTGAVIGGAILTASVLMPIIPTWLAAGSAATMFTKKEREQVYVSNDVDVIDMEAVTEEYIKPFETYLLRTRSEAIRYLEGETERLKERLKIELAKIDEHIKEKLKSLVDSEANLSQLESDMNISKNNLEWLNSIIVRIEKITKI